MVLFRTNRLFRRKPLSLQLGRFLATMCVAVLAACAAAPIAPVAAEETFAEWKSDFIDRAVAAGHDRAFVAATLADIEPIERLIELDRDQPEFVRPIWEYLDSAVSASRVNTGGERLIEETELLTVIERRWEVGRHALVAVWGLESAFGAVIGDTDVVTALATLAWEGRRRAFFEGELLAVFTILESGAASRSDLIGGWAGAMGQTQFMPSTYVQYAIDHDQDGRKDLWANRGDALASAAHYLNRFGWASDQPWGVEVTLPDAFDYALAGTTTQSVADWSALGLTLADGAAWDDDLSGVNAKLLLPAGAEGPAFLTLPNFEVIKRYNASTAYALGVGLLADRLAGGQGVNAAWPRDTVMLTSSQIRDLQRGLRQLGHDPRGIDGKVGPATQAALRAWQQANNRPADAFATLEVLQAVQSQL